MNRIKMITLDFSKEVYLLRDLKYQYPDLPLTVRDYLASASHFNKLYCNPKVFTLFFVRKNHIFEVILPCYKTKVFFNGTRKRRIDVYYKFHWDSSDNIHRSSCYCILHKDLKNDNGYYRLIKREV